MRRHSFLLWISLLLLSFETTQAAAKIIVGHEAGGSGFRFKPVPPPANNDAATQAQFIVVDGQADRNGGGLTVLHDGRAPTEEDQPGENFFFAQGTDGGRLEIDLGRVIPVKQVGTYSCHPATRAPQVYKLYASSGAGDEFNAAPHRPLDPETCGWTLVASVDTRPSAGEPGGEYAVAISAPEGEGGVLAKCRYLLFDISRTEDRDPFGNTFYSEIDVVDANGPNPTSSSAVVQEPILKSFDAAGGKYHFTIDATEAPDLLDWADGHIRPVVQEWYPKLITMLPSEGFEPATNVTLRFRNNMGGTPAAAGGNRINLNSGWFRREQRNEAVGAVVHEMVHVVQSYGRARRTNPNATRAPGWLVEGIADYIRWFLYEPQSKGAEITERNAARANYNSSYRITGNFLNWVMERYDHDIVRKLNASARQGNYGEQLWQNWTGKPLPDLGEEWKKQNKERLQAKQTGSE
jgi:hypothetical protein